MRWTLYDWLVSVAHAMQIEDACLPLCFSVIDRYLCAVSTFTKSNLAALGMCGLLIASKMFARDPPRAAEFSYYMEDHTLAQDLVRLEKTVMTVLGFSLLKTTTSSCGAPEESMQASPEVVVTCNYLLDLALVSDKTATVSLGKFGRRMAPECHALPDSHSSAR